MDIDAVDPSPTEPTFSQDIFPVPFRVLVLITFGILCFASNLDLLKRVGVQPSTLLCAPGDRYGISSRKIYWISAVFTVVIFFGWMLYTLIGSDMIITVTYTALFGILITPFDMFSRRERVRFLKTMKRVALEGLSSDVFLGDVVLADILTSFAKVLSDLYATSCHILFLGDLSVLLPDSIVGDTSEEGKPELIPDVAAACYYDIMGPIVTALPFAWRFRQCLAEYFAAVDVYDKRRHLANAAKYASAFPVIFLSAMQHYRSVHGNPPIKTDPNANPPNVNSTAWSMFDGISLVYLWLLFVAINSIYSFYWDVTVDWQLAEDVDPIADIIGISRNRRRRKHRLRAESDASETSDFSASSSDAEARAITSGAEILTGAPVEPRNPVNKHLNTSAVTTEVDTSARPRSSSVPIIRAIQHAKWLRPRLHFRDPGIYYLAVTLDLMLRFTWSLKLSTHLRLEELTLGGFAMEWLEIVRRWLWVFFRLEREWVAKGYGLIGGMENGSIEGRVAALRANGRRRADTTPGQAASPPIGLVT